MLNFSPEIDWLDSIRWLLASLSFLPLETSRNVASTDDNITTKTTNLSSRNVPLDMLSYYRVPVCSGGNKPVSTPYGSSESAGGNISRPALRLMPSNVKLLRSLKLLDQNP